MINLSLLYFDLLFIVIYSNKLHIVYKGGNENKMIFNLFSFFKKNKSTEEYNKSSNDRNNLFDKAIECIKYKKYEEAEQYLINLSESDYIKADIELAKLYSESNQKFIDFDKAFEYLQKGCFYFFDKNKYLYDFIVNIQNLDFAALAKLYVKYRQKINKHNEIGILLTISCIYCYKKATSILNLERVILSELKQFSTAHFLPIKLFFYRLNIPISACQSIDHDSIKNIKEYKIYKYIIGLDFIMRACGYSNYQSTYISTTILGYLIKKTSIGQLALPLYGFYEYYNINNYYIDEEYLFKLNKIKYYNNMILRDEDLYDMDVIIFLIVKNNEILYYNHFIEEEYFLKPDKDGEQEYTGRIVDFMYTHKQEVIHIYVAFKEKENFLFQWFNEDAIFTRFDTISHCIFRFFKTMHIDVFQEKAVYNVLFHRVFHLYKINDNWMLINTSGTKSCGLINNKFYTSERGEEIILHWRCLYKN